MTSDYSRPLQRVRQVGTGFLAGKASERPDIMSGLRDNVQFRVDSLRGMISGDDTMEGAQVGKRRMQIMQNRRELLMGGDSGTGSSSSSSSSRSGSIGASSGSMNEQNPTSSNDGATLMSEIQRGTRERALNRGFEG